MIITKQGCDKHLFIVCVVFCCPGEPVDKLYSCSKAAVVRDAAAKAMYARMFQWIISRINSRLQPRDNHSKTKASTVDDYLNIGIYVCIYVCMYVYPLIRKPDFLKGGGGR